MGFTETMDDRDPFVRPCIGTLPHPIPETRWLTLKDWRSTWVAPIFDELDRATEAPGWNPKLLRLDDDTLCIDITEHSRTTYKWLRWPHSVRVMSPHDHPFMAALKHLDHVPKAVKHLYRSEVQIRYARADSDCGQYGDKVRADVAWCAWHGVHDIRSAAAFLDVNPDFEICWGRHEEGPVIEGPPAWVPPGSGYYAVRTAGPVWDAEVAILAARPHAPGLQSPGNLEG